MNQSVIMRSGRGEDDRILSYGDATLVRSDLTILRGPHYLNDRLLHLFFCYLSRSRFGDEDEDVLLVPPSLAFLIANYPDGDGDPSSLAAVVAPLALPRRRLLLFPVNDNPDVSLPEGGSHWSLLVCHVPSRHFVHHDSSARLNSPHALRLFHSLRPFLAAQPQPQFIEGPTPQQTNGYDCGLYVMAIARCVCQWYSQGKNKESDHLFKDKWFAVLSEQLNANKVHQLRAELLSLVLNLMMESDSKNARENIVLSVRP